MVMNNLEVFIKDINLARYDSKDINDVMVMSIGRQEEFVRFALEDIEVLTSKKRGSPINKTPKSVYDIAKENHIQLDKSYVIVEKSSDGKYGKLQRVYDGENYNRRSIIEYATVSVDNIKAFMYAYDFKVLNAYLSKDTRLIIKKTYFPTIVVAYLYKIYFLGWKNFIDEYYYKEEIKERLNWLCKPYGSLSINCKNNFEVAILDEYFADCLNKKEFIDMLNMSKKNQYKFVQSMFEDIEKLCKR